MRPAPPASPAATSTLPPGRSVAECTGRAPIIVPVADQVPVAGS
ncbi:MAG TPA: hypothetical protein VGQ83_24085 [Polyangia bacterium]|jgi:hypothetical protein